MKKSKQTRFNKPLALTAVACACVAMAPGARAVDWSNTGTGWWNDPANWAGGVLPDNTGGWAIGNIGNGGTAIISNTVPHVSEAWAGNSGVAGTIIVTNGGTLPVDNWLVVGRTGNGGNTPLSTLIVAGNGIINKTGDGFIVGDGTFCTGQVFVKDNARINITGGWNGIGNGNGGIGSLTLQDNAVYTLAAQDWNIGDYGSGRGFGYIKDNATLNVSRFFVGKNDTAIGALWQTGGTINGTGGNANEWTIGGDAQASVDAFGFYSLSAGTLNCPFNFQVGRYGKGLLYQSGGTNIQSGWCDTARYAGSLGITWISGGLFQHIGTGTRYMVGENGRGEVTVSGTGVLETAMPLMMANGTSYLNLNGGLLKVPKIDKWSGTAYLNFNGGMVQAKNNDPSFLPGVMAEAVIYAGNLTLDTAGYDVTISQALIAPSGQGVVSIPVSDGGAGYMAPPIVQIDPSGAGGGATALAQIDPVAGKLTNILVTCSGYGYSAAPAVTLINGGASTPATLGIPVLANVSSGGLIKNGNGMLSLNGANTYTGATVVNAGKVQLTTAVAGASAYTVANGASLGLLVLSANAQAGLTSLSLDTATLDLDLGNYGNPTAAPINLAGALSVNGPIAVNIADALPQVGEFPLIKYGSRTGSGSFTIASIPSGVVATIVTNPAGSIDLKITAVSAPRWDGQAGGTWDIGLTTNWVELSTGLPAFFAQGNAVLFDDAALGTTSVNLGTTVNPAKVTVNNSVVNYTISGTGKISGAASLTKHGTGTLTLDTVNDYTGPTKIMGGTVVVTNLANGGSASALGSASSAPANLVLANGSLSYGGPAVAVNRGYSVQDTNCSINTVSDLGLGGLVTATTGSSFVKSGPAKLTHFGAGVKELSGGGFPGYNILAGTVVFDGTGVGQTNHNQNEFWVGSTVDAGASLILSNTVLNIDSWFAVGRGNGTVGNVSTATLYNSVLRSGSASLGYANNILGNSALQTLALNGTSSFTNNGDMNLGESGGSTSTILLNGNSSMYSGWRIHLGWHTGANAIMTLADSSSLTVNAWMSVGNEDGTGTLTVKDNSSLWVLWDMNVTDVGTGQGTMNLQNNATATANNFFIGKGAGSTGTMNQTGGSAIGRYPDGNEFQIGFHGAGTWNLSAGTIVAPGHWFVIGRYTDGPGILNVTGGTITHGNLNTGKLFRVGEEGQGTLNLSGTGSIVTGCDAVTMGNNATANGVVNLDGGTFQARRFTGGPGSSTFNFNGGVLRAGPNANPDFMNGLGTAFVLARGATIDTGTNHIAIGQSLLDGGAGGGLTKLGTGTLALMGTNTYTGATLVSAGTLGGSGVIAGGSVTVATGATLAPGASIGALSISNNLTLNGTTTMEISKDGGVVASDLVVVGGNIAFGGTLNVVLVGTNALAVNDTFNLFDWGTQSGSFTTTNLPSGYTWDLSKLAVDGTIRVSGIVLPPPVVRPPHIVGGNLIMTGTGGAPGTGYTWLTSVNVAAPAANWTTNSTGVFDAAGAFSNAIPINPAEPVRFYKMRVP